MLASVLITGSIFLFLGLWYVIYLISQHSKDPGRSSARIMRVILTISIIVLLVQDYIFKEIPSNTILIFVFIVVMIVTSSLPGKNRKKKNKYDAKKGTNF